MGITPPRIQTPNPLGGVNELSYGIQSVRPRGPRYTVDDFDGLAQIGKAAIAIAGQQKDSALEQGDEWAAKNAKLIEDLQREVAEGADPEEAKKRLFKAAREAGLPQWAMPSISKRYEEQGAEAALDDLNNDLNAMLESLPQALSESGALQTDELAFQTIDELLQQRRDDPRLSGGRAAQLFEDNAGRFVAQARASARETRMKYRADVVLSQEIELTREKFIGFFDIPVSEAGDAIRAEYEQAFRDSWETFNELGVTDPSVPLLAALDKAAEELSIIDGDEGPESALRLIQRVGQVPIVGNKTLATLGIGEATRNDQVAAARYAAIVRKYETLQSEMDRPQNKYAELRDERNAVTLEIQNSYGSAILAAASEGLGNVDAVYMAQLQTALQESDPSQEFVVREALDAVRRSAIESATLTQATNEAEIRRMMNLGVVDNDIILSANIDPAAKAKLLAANDVSQQSRLVLADTSTFQEASATLDSLLELDSLSRSGRRLVIPDLRREAEAFRQGMYDIATRVYAENDPNDSVGMRRAMDEALRAERPRLDAFVQRVGQLEEEFVGRMTKLQNLARGYRVGEARDAISELSPLLDPGQREALLAEVDVRESELRAAIQEGADTAASALQDEFVGDDERIEALRGLRNAESFASDMEQEAREMIQQRSAELPASQAELRVFVSKMLRPKIIERLEERIDPVELQAVEEGVEEMTPGQRFLSFRLEPGTPMRVTAERMVRSKHDSSLLTDSLSKEIGSPLRDPQSRIPRQPSRQLSEPAARETVHFYERRLRQEDPRKAAPIRQVIVDVLGYRHLTVESLLTDRLEVPTYTSSAFRLFAYGDRETRTASFDISGTEIPPYATLWDSVEEASRWQETYSGSDTERRVFERLGIEYTDQLREKFYRDQQARIYERIDND